MKTLTLADVEDVARGASVLGTGGGGDPLIGKLLVEQALSEGLEVTVIGLDELDDDALVVSTAMMGAPTVVVEKAPSGDEVVTALRHLEQRLGRTADAIIPMECGGLNSMIPLLSAARTGIPVVDADGMGRAFPELQMQTFGVYGVSCSPTAVADEHGRCVVVDTGSDNLALERLARAATVSMGGVAYIAQCPMSGADARRAAVPGTLSLAQDIGRLLREARGRHADPFEALGEFLRTSPYEFGTTLMTGKVTDVSRVIEGGWTTGSVTVESFDSTSTMEITFRNENLVARRDGRVVAVAPDLITVLDADTAAPITTEAVRYGMRVNVYGIATPPVMRTPEALAVFGPRCFGLDLDWEPLQALAAR